MSIFCARTSRIATQRWESVRAELKVRARRNTLSLVGHIVNRIHLRLRHLASHMHVVASGTMLLVT